MSADIAAILEQLPADQKINGTVCEHLDRQIRDGADLNPVQRETVFNLVKFCVEQNLPPPPVLESLCAFSYAEWLEEARASEDMKRRVASLVKLLKSNGAVAGNVARLAQEVTQKREARRIQLKRFAETILNASSAPTPSRRDRPARLPPKLYVRKMQEARLGFGANPMPNFGLAVQLAEEAIDSYPNTPLVLFEAAGCYQILGEKGVGISNMERYVNLRQAYNLYQRCHECLSAQPYAKLAGEYDRWRAGAASLMVKLHQELEKLQDKQR